MRMRAASLMKVEPADFSSSRIYPIFKVSALGLPFIVLSAEIVHGYLKTNCPISERKARKWSTR
jgi:hypothetical protein